jgi:ADP-ribosylglycohydrolase
MERRRIVASFLGGAIGDAAGLTTEFLGRGQIGVQYRTLMAMDTALRAKRFVDFDPAAAYPESHAHMRRIVAAAYDLEGIPRGLRGQHGVYTDDTSQLLAVIESLIACGGVVDRLDIAEHLWRWSVENGIGMGRSFYNAVSHERFLTNPHEAAFEFLESLNFYPAANGAVMRAAPLGALSLVAADTFHFLVADIAAITHANPRCILSAVFAASLVAGALRGLQGRDVVDLAVEKAQDVYANAFEDNVPWTVGIMLYAERCAARHWDDAFAELRGLVDGIWGYATLTSLAQLKPDCDMDDIPDAPIGYAYLPIRLVVAAIKLNLSYDVAVLQLVSLGGDADTNACVVGGVLGAMEPENPKLWAWAERLLPAQKDRVTHTAERLVNVLEAKAQEAPR